MLTRRDENGVECRLCRGRGDWERRVVAAQGREEKEKDERRRGEEDRTSTIRAWEVEGRLWRGRVESPRTVGSDRGEEGVGEVRMRAHKSENHRPTRDNSNTTRNRRESRSTGKRSETKAIFFLASLWLPGRHF